MRVLLVTHYYAEHRSGVEIVAEELAARLAGRGLDIVWAASGPLTGSVPKGVRALPMRAWNLTERRLGFPYPFWGPLSLWRLWRAVQRCDVVYLHDSLYMGNVAAYLFARWFRKPVVVTQHIGIIPYKRWWLRFLLSAANHTVARLVLGGCARCVFISRKVETYFSRFIRFRTQPSFIPNGVSTTVFQPVSPEERRRLRSTFGWSADHLVMVFVGRFVEKKGLPILRQLARRFPDREWVLIGWGPEDPARWGLANVRCPGQLDHRSIAAYYQAADLLVLPSVGEGFPLVVQEAMACGTPVLISADTAQGFPGIEKVALVSDLAEERLISLLEEEAQSPVQLEGRRQRTADFARRHWNWETSADGYQQLFAEVQG